MKLDHEALDNLIPLDSASFADAVKLDIDIPMRYAELVVTLRSGHSARLKRRKQLLGWTMGTEKRRYFFLVGDQVVVIRTDATRDRVIREIECWREFRMCRALSRVDPRVGELGRSVHMIVAPDGSLVFIAPAIQEAAKSARPTIELQQHRPAPAAVSLAT